MGCPGGGCWAGPAPGWRWPGSGRPPGTRSARRRREPAPAGVVPFRGQHQAGIITPAQDRLHFVALDLTTNDPAQVRALLRKWTAAAERMVAGAETTPGGAVNLNPDAPPTDTGEALGLAAASLTLTFGVGASLFDKLGLGALKPPGWPSCPGSPCDQIDPALSGGDLCIQACADDPQVAVHAVRNLVRMGFGTTAVRWSQLGLRAHRVDLDRAGHAAQPVRVQGRHAQRQGRGAGRAGRARLDPARRRAGLAGRRHLPGGPPDPDAHRDLGPHVAVRAGAAGRPVQGRRRAARASPRSSTWPTTARRARTGCR